MKSLWGKFRQAKSRLVFIREKKVDVEVLWIPLVRMVQGIRRARELK